MPGSQSAAERTTVRIDRAIVRAGLRTLVVAGFVGVAWLLSANAAQAADAPATDRTAGLSAVDLTPVLGADEVPPDGVASSTLVRPLTDAVTAAHQPVLGTAAATSTGTRAPAGTATSVVLAGTTAHRATSIADPALPAGAAGVGPFSGGDRPSGADAPDGGAGEIKDRRDVDPHIAPTGRAASNGAGQRRLLGSVRELIVSLGGTGRTAGSTLLTPLDRAVGPAAAAPDGVPPLVAGSPHGAPHQVGGSLRGVLRPVAAPLVGVLHSVPAWSRTAAGPGVGALSPTVGDVPVMVHHNAVAVAGNAVTR